MVTRACLRYTLGCLMSGICNLIKTAGMEKNRCDSPPKSTYSWYNLSHNICSRLCCTLFCRVYIVCCWRIQNGHIYIWVRSWRCGSPLSDFAINWQQNQVTRQSHLHDLKPYTISCYLTYIAAMLGLLWLPKYRQVSNIRRTKSQTLNVSCLGLQLFLSNPLKPGIKSRMKMSLEQRR